MAGSAGRRQPRDMSYDLIIVGGGIAGSSLGIAARRQNLRVLIVEAERRFRDRIRGEGLHSWGVREAKHLGIADLLYATCARALPLWDTYVNGARVERRDLPASTLAACESMAFFHPEMQTALLSAAEKEGAHVLRGAHVEAVEPGHHPRVAIRVEGDGGQIETARLVVIATGRGPAFRSKLGLSTASGEHGLSVSGIVLQDVHIPDDAVALYFAPAFGGAIPVFPLSEGRARVYVACNPRRDKASFSGSEAVGPFLERCHQWGVPRAWLEGARAAGPLATFDGTPTWAVGSWPQGTALLGDVAGSLDPAFGAGLSLALLDARTLIEQLTGNVDFAEGARRYERERASYYGKLLRLESWGGRIFYGVSSSDDAPLLGMLPRLQELGIDIVGAGPYCSIDDETERFLFGQLAV
jgi:2-polyprenyl-6-methoxyphenol hydroxylase-like FAD-dependent oxidoreductase